MLQRECERTTTFSQIMHQPLAQLHLLRSERDQAEAQASAAAAAAASGAEVAACQAGDRATAEEAE